MTNITDSDKRAVERVLTSKDWLVVERLILHFEESQNSTGSAKRDNEFETIWWTAHGEGSKNAVRGFIRYLEKLAKEAPEK